MAASQRSTSATSKRFCPEASRFLGKRCMPTNASVRSSLRSARRATAFESCSAALGRNWCSDCSSKRFLNSAKRSSRSIRLAANRAIAARSPSAASIAQVDPIAVCVGYRGSRIKAVREELAGEHIDVVRYSEDPEVLIPNALQPAEVEQVLLCDMIGRAIVLVQEDQLSLGDRSPRSECPPGQQAVRLGHRNHDRRANWKSRSSEP